MAVPSVNSLSEAAGGIFVPDEVSTHLNMLVRDASCVESIARHWPMKRETKTIRRQLTGVNAEWVGQTEAKPVDAPTFGPVKLEAETVAVIVPFTEEEIEDADTDVMAIVKDDVVSEFAEKLDATYLGYDAGSPFTDSWSGNVPAAHDQPYGTCGDLADDINEAISFIEQDGYEVTDMVAHPRVKAMLRGLRDANGTPIFVENLRDGFRDYSVYGVPICFTRQMAATGSPEATEILLAYGPYLYIGDRLALEVKLLTEATITQNGETIYLAQEDMVALRFRMRKAFKIKDDNALSKVSEVPMAGCTYPASS